MTVTWRDVDAIIEALNGEPGFRNGSTRGWRIPSPTGGTLLVEVDLQPRWCSITVDRWRTTDRDEAKSGPWFERHVWPHVDRALQVKRRGWGTMPCGREFSSASPVERSAVPEVLASWLDAEVTWGVAADSQWPQSAPHKVIPGPLGEFG